MQNLLDKIIFPEEVEHLLKNSPSVKIACNLTDLEKLACGAEGDKEWQVKYALPDGTEFHEADVVRVKNGISANYTEAYMRRRDPNCLYIADEEPSDKPKFNDNFDFTFASLRKETMDWLQGQELAVFAFEMGQSGIGGEAIAICPANAGFFGFGLALLQGIVDLSKINEPFSPKLIIYVAPPFRHTHFGGKQIVVHNRIGTHEIFSYNLYPGPSAKKGVYGALINKGVDEEWVTAHCSTVQVITPYDNTVCFMHEGASGGGKSEMLQPPHRVSDGRLLLGKNIISGQKRYIEIQRTCDLHPVCDDMGLCHPAYQEDNGKLWLKDAEEGWFIRVDHIREYGTDHDLEKMTIRPAKPLLFLNVDAVADGTALIWDHVYDDENTICPNPRVIVPREIVPEVINDKVTVDIRSFGVRTPPCTTEQPSYGILGLMHILPPALAWLWRLASPRGYANPSIVDTGAMSSEGVGSYWPFTTGRKVDQVNLLLEQFKKSHRTRYILTPNQHIGAWETGFMPQWLTRDYLARRGHAQFRQDQITPSRCSLLGYSLNSMRIEGATVPIGFLQVDQQPEISEEAYDTGATILRDFFHEQIKSCLHPELDPLGKKIIDCCLSNGSVDEYSDLLETSAF
ncbi:MAG: DUF4914 family protein [Spirochaetales bacterium]|nr:DUF4914 family protein [Spirochaetales bacterium]